MEININNYQNAKSDRGQEGDCQGNPLVSMVENIVKSCKALSSYEAACTMLLELVPMVASNQEALNALMRGKEEVRIFFERRNTPQPSTTIEGCNIFTGSAQAERFVGKDLEVGINCPGNQVIQTQNNNNKEKE